MYCYNCGNEIRNDALFCPFCGRSAETSNQQSSNNQYEETYNMPEPEVLKRKRQPEDNNKMVMLWVCITVLVLIICVFASIIIINAVNRDDEETQSIPQATPETVVVTQVPEESDEETFVRTILYNSSYTYNTMNDVHSSSPTDDKEALELKQVIHDFNGAWIEFINNYDNSVYNYLRVGTNPYNHAQKYEDKSLYQEYQLMDVMDVRKSNSYYYVWVHEIINETDYDANKKSVLEYHWVYRVGKDNDGYYIHDYIKDPAFK